MTLNLNLQPIIQKKIIKPSDKEATLHKEFLKNFLKKNYFN